MDRSSGILLPIFSLPSKYGIGTMGKNAYDFIDFLANSKQRIWQILPLGPTSFGDSPYQSFSSQAGNPYLIDLELLVQEGMLDIWDLPEECPEDSLIDYQKIYENRWDILYKVYKRNYSINDKNYIIFQNDNPWLQDYGLFMALKKYFGMRSWQQWKDDDAKAHKNERLKYYNELLSDDIQFYKYVQYIFFQQFNSLKDYAHKKDILLMGDLPIYAALDSVDVWANSEQFQLNEHLKPKKIAGVPPDYFSENGQLWGNPLYDWEKMKKDGYKFWIERIAGASKMYDIIRIDHFRGLQAYWAVDADAENAKDGSWQAGGGLEFVRIISNWFNNVQFVAEDLGEITDDVRKLINDCGFPSMKVIEFGMDPTDRSCHCPCNYNQNSICYLGTHDNMPIVGWYKQASKVEREYSKKYFNLNKKEGINWGFIRGGMSSCSNVFIAQMQDYLGLGNESRINIPSVGSGNWRWRMKSDSLDDKLANKIAELTEIYQRDKKK